MKVHLAAITETDMLGILRDRASFSNQHELVSEPDSANIILLLGPFSRAPQSLLEHPLYQAFPDRCAVYNEEDDYLPLLPGIYCSAVNDQHSRIGRVFSYAYVCRNGQHQNRFLGETSSQAAIGVSSSKRYLFTFLGGSTSLVRKRLFNLDFTRSDVLIENTSAYWHWDNSQPDRLDRQKHYAEAIAASRFVLCPRGAGAGSIRFFEVMAAGVAPVLLSDDYALPPGPDWDKFLIRVRERDIDQLPTILEGELATAATRGSLARQAYDEYFSIAREFDRVVDLAARSLRHGAPDESFFRKRQRAIIRRLEWRRKSRAGLRAVALAALKTFRFKNPYRLNQADR